MDPLIHPATIRSGLDKCLLLSRISLINKHAIEGYTLLDTTPGFTIIEALAQLGAMHVRWLCNFKQHGFLLKIETLSFPDHNALQGHFSLKGTLTTKSSTSFAYNLTAASETDVTFSGIFLFSVKAYDHVFKKTELEKHYRGIFSCLTSG